MPTRTVNISDELAEFVDTRIKYGDFTSASDAVRAGLLLLQARTAAANDPFEDVVRKAFIDVDPDEASDPLEGSGEEVMAAIRHGDERRHALFDRLDALIAKCLLSREYDYAGEVIEDALFHLEARLDQEPTPPGRNARLMGKVRSEDGR